MFLVFIVKQLEDDPDFFSASSARQTINSHCENHSVSVLIVLICAKRSLCAAFSVLPYGESFYLSDPTLNHPRRRHSSGNISATLEMLPGLEGFHLDTYGRVRSSTHTHTHTQTDRWMSGVHGLTLLSISLSLCVSQCRTPSSCIPPTLWSDRSRRLPST
ncbi:hypothetical protein INR49_010396 [Caranx melampygus]|nr:hypothetical protein INR49_010396 [Caranx melampygus]